MHVTNERRINSYDAAGRLRNQTVVDADGRGKADLLTDYDAAGNVTRTAIYVYDGRSSHEKSYYHHYALGEGYKETGIEGVVSRGGQEIGEHAFTTHTYDANGTLVRVTVDDEERTDHIRTLYTDAAGLVLQKNEDNERTHTLIVNGEVIGQSSDGNTAGSFSASYVPASADSLSAAPTAYTVQAGDTLKGIAKAVWGDASLWYLIADANGVSSLEGMEGQVIKLPTRANTIHNDYGTFQPYSAASAVGDTTPALVTPPPVANGGGGCGGLGQILMIIVSIVVTVMSGGGLVGAMLGNLAGQAVGIVAGVQDGFNWKSMALAVVAAGVAQVWSKWWGPHCKAHRS